MQLFYINIDIIKYWQKLYIFTSNELCVILYCFCANTSLIEIIDFVSGNILQAIFWH